MADDGRGVAELEKPLVSETEADLAPANGVDGPAYEPAPSNPPAPPSPPSPPSSILTKDRGISLGLLATLFSLAFALFSVLSTYIFATKEDLSALDKEHAAARTVIREDLSEMKGDLKVILKEVQNVGKQVERQGEQIQRLSERD